MHVCVEPSHVAFWQVRTGHAPQFTLCPQLLVTLPHLPPAQVVSLLSGVQHPLPVQTCPLAQQMLPLQQKPGAAHFVPG